MKGKFANILSIMLAAMLFVGVFAGCSSDETTTDEDATAAAEKTADAAGSAEADGEAAVEAGVGTTVEAVEGPEDAQTYGEDILSVLSAGTWTGGDGECITIRANDDVTWTYQSIPYKAEYINVSAFDNLSASGETVYDSLYTQFPQDQYEYYTVQLGYDTGSGADFEDFQVVFHVIVAKNASVENRTSVYIEREDCYGYGAEDSSDDNWKQIEYNEDVAFTQYTRAS